MNPRRAFLATLGGAYTAGMLRYPAGAAEFSYKLSMDRPASDPNVAHARDAVAKIMSESSGQLEIKVFPQNALGGNTQVLPQVRVGAVEFTIMVDVITSNIVPSAAINAVGFAFPDYKAVWDAMDGALGKYVSGQIEQQMGVRVFDTIWDGGFKQISNSAHPILKPDDLKGLKIRATPGAISVSLYKTLGSSPVAMDTNEMYTAEQTKLVDGADTSADLVLTGGFWEVQKYLALTNHAFVVFHFLASMGPWQKLPKNLQDMTERNFNAAAKALRLDASKNLNATLTALRAKGVQINQPDIAPFRAALRSGGYYSYWREKFGAQPWSILEKTVGQALS